MFKILQEIFDTLICYQEITLIKLIIGNLSIHTLSYAVKFIYKQYGFLATGAPGLYNIGHMNPGFI